MDEVMKICAYENRPAAQCDQQYPARRRHQQPHSIVGDRVRQQAQRARQRPVENDVIEDDLERPRLQQLRRGGPQRAHRRDGQAL